MRQACKCGKGYVSAWDGKCGHCRSQKEQREHEWKLRNVGFPGGYEKP